MGNAVYGVSLLDGLTDQAGSTCISRELQYKKKRKRARKIEVLSKDLKNSFKAFESQGKFTEHTTTWFSNFVASSV